MGRAPASASVEWWFPKPGRYPKSGVGVLDPTALEESLAARHLAPS